MAFIVDSTETMPSGIIYSFIKKHRCTQSYREASKWLITCKREFELAIESRDNNFVVANNLKYSWNVERINNKLQVIGIQSGINEYISRFELGNNGTEMHGYPINHISNPKDKPNNTILSAMQKEGKLEKREMVRIKGGKEL